MSAQHTQQQSLPSQADLELVRLFPDAGFHPARLRRDGADGTARRVARVMASVGLPEAKSDMDGRIVVPASYEKRRAELDTAEKAGFDAMRSICGTLRKSCFVNHPRCPYRDPGKILFWERGYEAAWNAWQEAAA